MLQRAQWIHKWIVHLQRTIFVFDIIWSSGFCICRGQLQRDWLNILPIPVNAIYSEQIHGRIFEFVWLNEWLMGNNWLCSGLWKLYLRMQDLIKYIHKKALFLLDRDVQIIYCLRLLNTNIKNVIDWVQKNLFDVDEDDGIKKVIAIHFCLISIPPIPWRDGVWFIIGLLFRTWCNLNAFPCINIMGNTSPHRLFIYCINRKFFVIIRQLFIYDTFDFF